MSVILVTGGAGFIGSHLCERLLLMGHRVLCLDNFNNTYDPAVKRCNVAKALRHSHYRLTEGDILDESLAGGLLESSKADAVVHLAALAGVRRSILAPLDYVDVDIKGTVSLLEACRKHNVKKFIFASSSSVYGACPSPFREAAAPGAQISPYAAAKRCGELYCETYSLLYGIRISCLRFFTVYGPRQRPDMAIHTFTKAISEGGDIFIYGDGSSSRDYTYVDDIVDGIIAALDLDRQFEIFNLGNSNTVNIMSLVEILGNKLGKEVRCRFMPEQQGDAPSTCADIGKAAGLLGYSPKVKLEEGIERFVAWYANSQKPYSFYPPED